MASARRGSDDAEKRDDAVVARFVIPEAAAEVLPEDLAELILNATDADLISADPRDEIQKGNANAATAWLFSPALLNLSALACKRLDRVGELLGIREHRITRVRARFIGRTKVLHLKPAPHTDKGATPVGRYKGAYNAWINLIDLLGPAKLACEPGFKERFDVYYVPKGSKLSPGVIIDLGKRQERAEVPPRKRKGKGTST